MTQVKHGLQVFDGLGAPIMEVGVHVIHENPEFAQELGIISASWGQAEVNLNCLFAVLLDVTPAEAAEQLKRREYNSAQKVTCAAKKIANESLTGAELDLLINMLDQFDLVRKRRNRLQHDVWAKKGTDNNKMFCIHSDQYLAFTTQFFEVSGRLLPDSERADQLTQIAYQFADSIEAGYTINDLQEIFRDIKELSQSLMQVMFLRISQHARDS